MRTILVSLTLAGVGSGLAVSTVEAQQRRAPLIRNYQAQGNLESMANIGCISMREALPRYNPIDLFKAARSCLDARRVDDAANIYLLAMAYGRFDMLRVADSTAHQAVTVAKMEIFGDVAKETTDSFSSAMTRLITEAAAHTELCAEIRRIGPPTYQPRYMIQHGMGAFLGGKGDGLVAGFEADLHGGIY